MASKVLALQAWCKKQCHGYKHIEITNMTTSWRSGLAFCAIIHRYHPELIDYDSLNKDNIYENNKLAFDAAATLGISPFLDPEDMVALKVPDKLSILTYVSQYYNVFGKQTPRELESKPATIKRSAEKIEINSEEAKKRRNQSESINNTRTYISSEDICHICKSKVYLIERHFDSNHLYHHSCWRNLDASCLKSSDTPKDHSKSSDLSSSKSEERVSGKKVGKEELKSENGMVKSSDVSTTVTAAVVDQRSGNSTHKPLSSVIENKTVIKKKSAQQNSEEKTVKNSIQNKSIDEVAGVEKEELKSENGMVESSDVSTTVTAIVVDQRSGNSTHKSLSSVIENKTVCDSKVDDFNKSEMNLKKQHLTSITAKFSPKLSCSDTLLTLTKPQEARLNEIVRRNCEKTEKEKMDNEGTEQKPRMIDNNSNNKSLNSPSASDCSSNFDTSSSSGSDSTLKVLGGSQLSVIDTMTERADTRRPTASVLCGQNERSNVNLKGGLINLRDFDVGGASSSCSLVAVSSQTSFQSWSIYASPTVSKSGDLDIKSILRKGTVDHPRIPQHDKHAIPLSASEQKFPAPRMILTNTKKPSSSVDINSDSLPVRTSPQIPPRSFSVYKQIGHSHLEGWTPKNSTGAKTNNLKREGEISSRNKTTEDIAPTPKPRKKKEMRHSMEGQAFVSSEVLARRVQNTPAINPLPRHKSFLISKTSKSPPPRPPPPASSQGSASSTSLPFILKVHPWPEGHDSKISHCKSAPMKPPRLIARETNKKTEQSKSHVVVRDDPLDIVVSRSNDYKPHQVICSTTFPTVSHPLAHPPSRPPSQPSRPPPRPSEPPKKKILPQSKFHFESISFEDNEAETLFAPVLCKSDKEKKEICCRLKTIDDKLKEIETEGKILEQVIRSDHDSLSDENVITWFNLINYRNELVREETDLRYRCQQLDLEKEHASIERQLRTLMMISDKTPSQRMREEQLIAKLLDVVGRKSNIVDSQEDDRIRYLKEDEALMRTRELSLGREK